MMGLSARKERPPRIRGEIYCRPRENAPEIAPESRSTALSNDFRRAIKSKWPFTLLRQVPGRVGI